MTREEAEAYLLTLTDINNTTELEPGVIRYTCQTQVPWGRHRYTMNDVIFREAVGEFDAPFAPYALDQFLRHWNGIRNPDNSTSDDVEAMKEARCHFRQNQCFFGNNDFWVESP